jgi:7-carboxy-7-deazaguanine synthase
LKISELFYSVQGEGKRTGYPSFFIRTNYCNLRCKFTSGNLCDSAYTSWYPEDENNIGDIAIEKIIDEYKKYEPADVVITGGEPVLQLRELTGLCREIKSLNNNIFITVETNGTFFGEYVSYANLISISPKLSSSTPAGSEYEKSHEKNRINIETLKKYHESSQRNEIDIQWKFVVNSENDIDEIKFLQNEIGIENKNIFLMPEGISEKDLTEKSKFVVKLCKKYHYNFTHRLHILIWGNKRGK